MGRQCCIIGKEGLPDGDAADLCFRAESGQIEEAPIGPCVKVHTVIVVLEGIGQEHGEEDPEQCRSEHTSLLHGSYNFKETKFKDFSRTFQGQNLVFKDSVLFTKLTFLVPLLTLKTLNSVITYLRYVNSSAMVDDVSP